MPDKTLHEQAEEARREAVNRIMYITHLADYEYWGRKRIIRDEQAALAAIDTAIRLAVEAALEKHVQHQKEDAGA